MKVTLPLSPLFIESQGARLVSLLDRFEKTGGLHQAILFTGIEGVGKKSLTLHFVDTLFCDESLFANTQEESDSLGLFGESEPTSKKTGRTPCGKCKSCLRSSQAQWLDLYWFDPESSDEDLRLGIHKIDAFRDLKTKLGLGPLEEPFKIVVIADADRMTPAAANSILKMLEEPPKNWLFLLTASDSSRLLPTILSRCMEIRLNPLPPETIFEILKGTKGSDFNSTRAKVASRSANGSLSRATHYMGDEVWTLRDHLIGLLSNPAGEWLKLIDQIAKSQIQMHVGLDLLESILSDLLHSRVEGDSYVWTHADQKELLLQSADARDLTASRLCKILETIAEKRKWVNLTLNSKLLAQEILIPVLEAL